MATKQDTEATTKEALLAQVADARALANEAEQLVARLDVTMAALAPEAPEDERARTISRLRALVAECLAMADEARATIARLDSIPLP